MLGFLVEGHIIYILCQIHVQVVEYIFDDQPLNSEQVSDSHMFVNLHQQPQLQETACGYYRKHFRWLLYSVSDLQTMYKTWLG